ncbi:MAG: OFA family MFS transporter [Verrucomicrobia bacterium]|nr:OFA family MFS transporter [Verrucomicrobiota bacterium]MCH8528442.1 OFA family MFS transporter [Kiritimatiellia bacterium]
MNPETAPSRTTPAAAAVGIHLSIGSVYAYSVWKTPLEELTGWQGAQIAMGFSLAILFLGLSAGFLGSWIDRMGPRRSSLLAGCLFGLGLAGAGLSVHHRWLWGYYISYGALGGIGLGIGYVAPVATLVRWFPDRRGFATGLATMGFGFGALLAGPLIARFTLLIGVPNTFFLLAALYSLIMILSALKLNNPPADWPERFPPPPGTRAPGVTSAPDFPPRRALRSPAFLLLWLLFFINICCGIALISIASPMARDMTGMSLKASAAMVGAMGLFNGLGRIGWSAASDRLGRPLTWLLFFLLQIASLLLLPSLAHPLAFQLAVFLIISCYGGGFATAPAFLGDLFGTRHLAALYGALLTAWAAAGLAGPQLVTRMRESTGSYQTVLSLFALFLTFGLFALAGLHFTQKRSFR